MSDSAAPEGYQTVIPYLVLDDPEAGIEFMENVFEGRLTERVLGKEGRVQHAEVTIGDTVVMIGVAREGVQALPAMLYVYCADTDATYRRALEAGATSVMEPADQFYGDRSAGVRDSNGISWWMGTRKEELSREELQRRTLERENV
ncbi:VOC family protein [Sulfidibacter corallicola]|uniref:VOC family protein n=1 Tax=Sulfidibacter corallicola TaxID=2818388 RepID=A0A8A4TGV6_SULCO|nr:VOC family protein [Sulfidibacter corallicola]QTD49156.1 VOC family protein [Sulfidibacter corallicola]